MGRAGQAQNPFGQIVGQLSQVPPSHQLIYQLVEEYVDAAARLHELTLASED